MKYLQHKDGGVSTVSDDDYEENYLVGSGGFKGAGIGGDKRLDPDWKELTEEEARALNPQLFGETDPAVAFCELR